MTKSVSGCARFLLVLLSLLLACLDSSAVVLVRGEVASQSDELGSITYQSAYQAFGTGILQGTTITDQSPEVWDAEIEGAEAQRSFDFDIKQLEIEMQEAEPERNERMMLANALRPDALGIVSFKGSGEDHTKTLSDEMYLAMQRLRALNFMPENKLDYAKGFAVDFAKGGAEMVGGLAGIATAVGKTAYKGGKVVVSGLVWHTKVGFKLITGQSVETEIRQAAEVASRARAATDAAINKAQYFKELSEQGTDAILAILSGDFSKLNHMSGPLRTMMSYSIELIVGTLEKYNGTNASSYDKGFFMGRTVFELASIFVPGGVVLKGLAKGSKFTKLQFLEKVGDIPFFQSNGKVAEALGSVKNRLVNKLTTTKMCFIAGTIVAVASPHDDLVHPTPIEQITEQSLVWARDEVTGEVEKCRVLHLFTTRPDHLHHVCIDTDSDGQADETLSGTAEHPFWDKDAREWVRMGDLEPGTRLFLLGEGDSQARTQVYVLANQRQNAPPGKTFTTYNFEVERCHTYFVGEAGVWVHNNGKSPCDEVFSALEELLKPGNPKSGKPWEAFDEVATTMGRNRNSSIFGWAADEVMRRQLKELPLIDRISQWPSHSEIKKTMSRVKGPRKEVDLGGTNFGQIDVPHWVVKDRIDLQSVRSFSLESHHGVPKKVQDWLGLTKDKDSSPAYLTTMLEHRGAEVGIHQKLSQKLGEKLNSGPVNLNQPMPAGFVGNEHLIREALRDTYKEFGLEHFWEVCEVWIATP